MLGMLLLALTVFPSCRTQYAPPAVDASPALKELIPELPELPAWPDLNWQYEDGRYSLSEAEVDKILDYWENQIPMYQYQIKLFKDKLAVVLDFM